MRYKWNSLKEMVADRRGYATPDEFPDHVDQPEIEVLRSVDGGTHEGWVVWAERVSTDVARVRLGLENGMFVTILVNVYDPAPSLVVRQSFSKHSAAMV
jgi:hypothetical protein